MSAQTSQTETAKQWFVNFLTYFRKECDAISLEEKSFIPADLNYLPPCQIELVWLTQPEYQFIVKSNFADRPDMEVKIHGPYSHDEFIDRVDELVNSPAWNKPIGHGPYGSNNFSDVLASFLNTFMNTVRGSLFRPIAAAHQSIGMYGGDSVWVSFFSGNRTIGDYVASANSTITELKKRNGAPKPSSSVSSTTTAATPDGFVTFFYPPLRLGQRPKFTPSAILRGAIFDLSEHEKAFDASFRGRDIVVNKTGRVFVAERNKEQALRILNLIMAVGTLRGIDLYAVREHELVEAQYNKEKKEVGGTQLCTFKH